MNAALLETDRQHYGRTLAVLVIAALAFALQQTMVAPALPAIQEDLGASATTVTFVLTGFLLTASVSTPIIGRLGDMFGKERMLVICLIMFAAGSLVCALSHSIEVLIAGRAIQGSAAAVFPLSFGIIRDEFPAEKVGMGIGLISATFGIGGGAGLVLSGLIVDNVPYEWIFWFALPAILIAIVMTFLFIPESPIKSPAKIDWGGAALLSTTLVCLLVGVSEANSWGWGDTRIIGLFAASLIASVTWVRYERGQPQPLVDISMMRERAVFTTNATALLVGFGMFGSFILIPMLVQLPSESGVGFGATVTEAGLFMAPSAAIMLFAGPLAGWLGSRVGSRTPLMIGTALIVVSFAVLAAFHETRGWIYASSAILGLGIGFAFASMANLVVEAVHPSKTGVATGINTIMRTIGGSLGGQIAATIVAAHVVASTGFPSAEGFELAFALSAGVMVLAFLAAFAIPKSLPYAPERPVRSEATPATSRLAGSTASGGSQ
ncbi:MAG TPA: MFS transporter [Solirubrobacterales bacterium]|nr:MFS transporter [Solirubrobacterales bacterium]